MILPVLLLAVVLAFAIAAPEGWSEALVAVPAAASRVLPASQAVPL